MNIFDYTILFLTIYLIGSIPFGLVLTKLFLKQDIRKIGSGNIGATNVLRTGSKILAILTVILDALKPFFAYWAVRFVMSILISKLAVDILFGLYDVYLTMIIVAITILAHCFPIYLKFKGGKGVATVFGSLFMFSSKWSFLCINGYVLPLMALITWIVVAIISKKSSLSALVTAVMLPLYVYLFANYRSDVVTDLTMFYGCVSLFVILRHISNIKRLIKGEESNIKLHKDNE
ncbi:MAG: glycerol-3-phosphate 1-O-acyltransferase PlsY [Alphaproteobacteria bacterium]